MSAPNASPNVTPFLDILLVVLIIFMVAATSEATLNVQLPDPTARGAAGAVPLVLEVGAGGRYALNQAPVPRTALRDRLVVTYRDRPDKVLMVRGAPDATYQEVMTAMDVAKGAGVKVLGVDTHAARR